MVGDFECPLCITTFPYKSSTALGCGHRFCHDCWKGWLNAEAEKGPQAIFTNCPHFKCGEMVPDSLFLNLLEGEKKVLFRKWLMRNFIEGNQTLKWCPGKNCNKAVKYDGGGQKDIVCECGHRWCFNCCNEAHQPCPCHLVSAWTKKNKSDSENTDWIVANTKICPKCKVHIEKNQGCNHMTCRNCKHEFCWLCGGDWKQHGSNTGGFYTCNTFEKNKSNTDFSSEELKVQNAQNALNKYIFYFDRFTGHGRAVEFARKTFHQVENTMKQLQEKKQSNIKSVDFLIQGVQTVIQCRHALKWSYVLGFYLKDRSSAKKLFEDDQGHLEELADKLHGMVERPMEQLQSDRLREEIITLNNATRKYQQNLEDGIMGTRYESGLQT